jgi:hypothetical protein
MRLRTFWRIIFDVVDSLKEDGLIEARPRLRAEMTLWDVDRRSINYNTQLAQIMEEITPDVFPGDGVTFANGVASFYGGHIWGKFDRTMLETKLVDLALESRLLAGAEFEELSIVYGGTNVSIVAHVRLPLDAAQPKRPLFYMYQPPRRRVRVHRYHPRLRAEYDAVQLVEHVNGNGYRTVQWTISGDDHHPAEQFRINDEAYFEPLRGWHKVRVLQDMDSYRIAADSVPLGPARPASPSDHLFSGDAVEFYVGGMREGEEIIGLHGEISYLEFDPNSSCTACAN